MELQLSGWGSPGRNLTTGLFSDFTGMIELLADPNFLRGRTWTNEVQADLARALNHITDAGQPDAGQIRTIKSTMESLRMLQENALTSSDPIVPSSLLTHLGEALVAAVSLQKLCDRLGPESPLYIPQDEIEKIYRNIIARALLHYGVKMENGEAIPLVRTTVTVLRKYGSLDKIEWYIMTSCIKHENDPSEWDLLEKAFDAYRNDKLLTSAAESQKKSHQYLPQMLEYGGFIVLSKHGRGWVSMVENPTYNAVNDPLVNGAQAGTPMQESEKALAQMLNENLDVIRARLKIAPKPDDQLTATDEHTDAQRIVMVFDTLEHALAAQLPNGQLVVTLDNDPEYIRAVYDCEGTPSLVRYRRLRKRIPL